MLLRGDVTMEIRKIVKKQKLVIVVLFLVGIAAISSRDFLSIQNFANILSQISVVAILAIGQTIVIVGGGFDLSHGSFIAFGSVMIAITMKFGLLPSLILTVISLLVLGFINGFFVNQGINPFVVTLGMLGIARSLALVLSNAKALPLEIESFQNLAYTSIGPFKLPVYLMGLMFLVFHYVMRHTKLGRSIYATGGGESAARLSGIQVNVSKYAAFMLSALTAAIAAMVYTASLNVAIPDKAVGYELDSIAAAVIGGASLSGGVGTMWGTFIGALIYGIISNLFNLVGLHPYFQQILKGFIILGAVFLNIREKK